jgi:hypothetical protein
MRPGSGLLTRSSETGFTLRAAPVRQSDHGANVNSETATTLMTIVAITTPKRSRSRPESPWTWAITMLI